MHTEQTGTEGIGVALAKKPLIKDSMEKQSRFWMEKWLKAVNTEINMGIET